VARRLILDTTVLIAAERGTHLLDQFLDDADDVSIAAITAAELLVGVELADEARRPRRASFVNDLLAAIPAEDYNLTVARQHARLLAHVRRAGKPRGAYDLIIAATAIATRRALVTADAAAEFDNLPDLDCVLIDKR
jgi:tRNA(fMet)-specific endonuclease VapC